MNRFETISQMTNQVKCNGEEKKKNIYRYCVHDFS